MPRITSEEYEEILANQDRARFFSAQREQDKKARLAAIQSVRDEKRIMLSPSAVKIAESLLTCYIVRDYCKYNPRFIGPALVEYSWNNFYACFPRVSNLSVTDESNIRLRAINRVLRDLARCGSIPAARYLINQAKKESPGTIHVSPWIRRK